MPLAAAIPRYSMMFVSPLHALSFIVTPSYAGRHYAKMVFGVLKKEEK